MDRTERFLFPQDPLLELGALRPDHGRHDVHWAQIHDRRTYLYYYYARNAIYQGLKALGLPADAEVLIPAYHCAAAVEPVCRYGATAVFYRIRRDLSPDLEDIEKRITDRARALMCIHYLGFPQPVVDLKAICQRRGLRLIEDCAHVLSGTVDRVPLGGFGDISVFSLRKFFPTNDGGLLVINSPGAAGRPQLRRPGVWHTLKIAKNLLERGLKNSPNRGARTMGGWLERLRPPLRSRLQSPAPDPAIAEIDAVDWSDVHFEIRDADMGMSRFSKWVLGHQDVDRTIRQRKNNYRTLAGELADCSRVKLLFPDLPLDVCPLHCPLVIEGEREYHRELRSRGVPATTWGKVVHPKLSRSEFPEADHLYHKLILLPVHQGLGAQEMKLVARLVREVALLDAS